MTADWGLITGAGKAYDSGRGLITAAGEACDSGRGSSLLVRDKLLTADGGGFFECVSVFFL